jgi:subtilisin family serine protease
MRRQITILWIASLVSGGAIAQTSPDPSTVDYIFAHGKQIHLTQIKDEAFYRIQAASKLIHEPQIRESIENALGMVAVHGGFEHLAVRKAASLASAARAAISRLTRTGEADQLRVFSNDGGKTLLVEFPEIILQCDETIALAQVRQYLSAHYQVTVQPTGLAPGQFLVHLATPSHTLWLANQLRSTNAIPIRYADVNFWFAKPQGGNAPRFPTVWPSPAGAGRPNDPAFRAQWALENLGTNPSAAKNADIGFARAFRIAPPDATGIKVAVLDYAIDVNHPELKGTIDSVFNATRYDVTKGLNDPDLKELDFREQPESEADHGTACAGIIAALTSNKLGISGVASGAKIVAIQIATPGVDDVKLVSGLTLLAALQAAQAAGARVVSLSWSFQLPSEEANDSIRVEIDQMNKAYGNRGILVVSAAGDDSLSILAPDFPAIYSDTAVNLIAAGASNWCGEVKVSGSCDTEPWNSRYNDHTLFAPGVGIFTITNQRDKTTAAALNNYRTNFNGTSAATPLIAAAAALVLKQHSEWTATQVRDHLMKTAGKLKNGGKPLLNICNALYGPQKCSAN